MKKPKLKTGDTRTFCEQKCKVVRVVNGHAILQPKQGPRIKVNIVFIKK